MSITVQGVTALLQVFNMRVSVAFYRDVLGFELVQQHEPDGNLYWAMLKLGGAVIMLNSQYEAADQPAERDRRREVNHGDMGLFFACADVDAAYAHLRDKGVELKPPFVRDYGMKQLYQGPRRV